MALDYWARIRGQTTHISCSQRATHLLRRRRAQTHKLAALWGGEGAAVRADDVATVAVVWVEKEARVGAVRAVEVAGMVEGEVAAAGMAQAPTVEEAMGTAPTDWAKAAVEAQSRTNNPGNGTSCNGTRRSTGCTSSCIQRRWRPPQAIGPCRRCPLPSVQRSTQTK